MKSSEFENNRYCSVYALVDDDDNIIENAGRQMYFLKRDSAERFREFHPMCGATKIIEIPSNYRTMKMKKSKMEGMKKYSGYTSYDDTEIEEIEEYRGFIISKVTDHLDQTEYYTAMDMDTGETFDDMELSSLKSQIDNMGKSKKKMKKSNNATVTEGLAQKGITVLMLDLDEDGMYIAHILNDKPVDEVENALKQFFRKVEYMDTHGKRQFFLCGGISKSAKKSKVGNMANKKSVKKFYDSDIDQDIELLKELVEDEPELVKLCDKALTYVAQFDYEKAMNCIDKLISKTRVEEYQIVAEQVAGDLEDLYMHYEASAKKMKKSNIKKERYQGEVVHHYSESWMEHYANELVPIVQRLTSESNPYVDTDKVIECYQTENPDDDIDWDFLYNSIIMGVEKMGVLIWNPERTTSDSVGVPNTTNKSTKKSAPWIYWEDGDITINGNACYPCDTKEQLAQGIMNAISNTDEETLNRYYESFYGGKPVSIEQIAWDIVRELPTAFSGDDYIMSYEDDMIGLNITITFPEYGEVDDDAICPYCHEYAPAQHLGNLGNKEHWKCNNCGMMYSRDRMKSTKKMKKSRSIKKGPGAGVIFKCEDLKIDSYDLNTGKIAIGVGHIFFDGYYWGGSVNDAGRIVVNIDTNPAKIFDADENDVYYNGNWADIKDAYNPANVTDISVNAVEGRFDGVIGGGWSHTELHLGEVYDVGDRELGNIHIEFHGKYNGKDIWADVWLAYTDGKWEMSDEFVDEYSEKYEEWCNPDDYEEDDEPVEIDEGEDALYYASAKKSKDKIGKHHISYFGGEVQFDVPDTIDCGGGTLRYSDDGDGIVYEGKVDGAYVIVAFWGVSGTKGEELDVFVGNSKSELEYEGLIDPITGTEGKFDISEIPEYVNYAIKWCRDRGYIKHNFKNWSAKKSKVAKDYQKTWLDDEYVVCCKSNDPVLSIIIAEEHYVYPTEEEARAEGIRLYQSGEYNNIELYYGKEKLVGADEWAGMTKSRKVSKDMDVEGVFDDYRQESHGKYCLHLKLNGDSFYPKYFYNKEDFDKEVQRAIDNGYEESSHSNYTDNDGMFHRHFSKFNWGKSTKKSYSPDYKDFKSMVKSIRGTKDNKNVFKE